MVIGHQEIVQRLEAELPPVSLFLGPYSVGKWTTAEHLRRHHKVEELDTLRIRKLTVDAARDLLNFSRTAPSHGLKLALVNFSGATPLAQNFLLKALEESHRLIKFILITTYSPLETVVSRSTVFPFSLLSEDEVAQVLQMRKVKPGDAKAMAERANGSVKTAFKSLDVGEFRPLVVLALRAIAAKDADALEQVAGRWTDEHTEYTRAWAREALTGRWRWFTAEDFGREGTRVPLRILIALRPDIRPKLVVRASLMTVLKEAQ